MEGNRFMKHEVKNGLLNAIGLCDQFRDSGVPISPGPTPKGSPPLLPSSEHNVFDVKKCMYELDLTLREVLDTILAQSMARDVMHGSYEPKVERVDDILAALYGVRGQDEDGRFPLVTRPSPLPVFMADPQLLRFIHKNAISNACKYGQKGGTVVTEISLEKDEIVMEVINLPGPFHKALLQMGNAARKAVFEPGKRLHPDLGVVQDLPGLNQSQTHSSGDGGWIMKKCAKALSGDCLIQFDESRTVFSLRCPVKVAPFERKMSVTSESGSEQFDDAPKKFSIPSNTWGIGIDDSGIQRKVSLRLS